MYIYTATDSMRCILLLSPKGKEKTQTLSNLRSWQGQKDSNPQQRFWRPTCYHYTMPLRCLLQRQLLYLTPPQMSTPQTKFVASSAKKAAGGAFPRRQMISVSPAAVTGASAPFGRIRPARALTPVQAALTSPLPAGTRNTRDTPPTDTP